MLQIGDKQITVCEKICCECAFNGSSKDVLYAETKRVIKDKQIFPCHMYLKSKTGCEFLGTETLSTIKVCRGYVAFMKKFHEKELKDNYVWEFLLNKIEPEELNSILNLNDLVANNCHLREGVYLGN